MVSHTYSTQITIGGQTVDYKVYWNQGSTTNTWVVLASSTSGATTYTTTATLTEGLDYQFYVVAFNNFGDGPSSTTITVYAAIAPSGLSDPTTTYNSADSTVVIDWTPPSDNGGLAVSYTIQVKDGSNNWVTVTQSSQCAETSSDILSLTQCTITVSTLSSTYSLSTGSYVVAKITATNSIGSVTSGSAGLAQMP